MNTMDTKQILPENIIHLGETKTMLPTQTTQTLSESDSECIIYSENCVTQKVFFIIKDEQYLRISGKIYYDSLDELILTYEKSLQYPNLITSESQVFNFEKREFVTKFKDSTINDDLVEYFI